MTICWCICMFVCLFIFLVSRTTQILLVGSQKSEDGFCPKLDNIKLRECSGSPSRCPKNPDFSIYLSFCALTEICALRMLLSTHKTDTQRQNVVHSVKTQLQNKSYKFSTKEHQNLGG